MSLIGRPLHIAHLTASMARQVLEEPPVRAATVRQRAGGRIQVLELNGVLLPGYLRRFRRAISAAAEDPNVRAIAILADSPGGSVSGSLEASQAVAAAAKKKPVITLAEGMLASAAYFVAVESSEICASPSCVIGSLGVVISLIDDSAFWESQGVRFVHVTTALKKVANYPGQPVLEEHVALAKEIIEFDQLQFEAAIERGRGLRGERLAAVTDGGVWAAPLAKLRGLIDRVATPEQRLAELEAEHREQYADLSGLAAVNQLDKLAQECGSKAFSSASSSLRDRLTAEYPTLVAAAEAHRKKLNRVPVSYHVPRGP